MFFVPHDKFQEHLRNKRISGPRQKIWQVAVGWNLKVIGDSSKTAVRCRQITEPFTWDPPTGFKIGHNAMFFNIVEFF